MSKVIDGIEKGLSMKKNKTIKTVFLVLIVAVAITGCAASVTHMIPSFNHTTFVSTDKTLMVAEVKGGEKSKPFPSASISKIENEGFHEALTNTLKESGIFKEVFTAEKGDYEIYAEIMSYGLGRRSQIAFSIASTLSINYRLIEADSGKEVWKENILSQYNTSKGAKQANEGTVRYNLTQLIKKLSNVLSKLNKK